MDYRLLSEGRSVQVLYRLVNARNDHVEATNVLCKKCNAPSFEEDRVRMRQEGSTIIAQMESQVEISKI